jgi:hypothetical protein
MTTEQTTSAPIEMAVESAVQPPTEAKKAKPAKAKKSAPKAAKPKSTKPKGGAKMKTNTAKKLSTSSSTATNGPRMKGMQIYHAKRIVGPAMKDFIKKVKKTPLPGICQLNGCKTKVTARAKWCATHKKEIRKAQLKANNEVWRKRVKDGIAGHHVVYKNRPTIWAAQNKQHATKFVQAGHAVVTPETWKTKVLPKAEIVLKQAGA